MNEYLLIEYFFKTPRHPHSLHLYRLANLENFTEDSNKFFALLLLIVPIFPHEGHREVSGYVLKNILNCNTNLV